MGDQDSTIELLEEELQERDDQIAELREQLVHYFFYFKTLFADFICCFYS